MKLTGSFQSLLKTVSPHSTSLPYTPSPLNTTYHPLATPCCSQVVVYPSSLLACISCCRSDARFIIHSFYPPAHHTRTLYNGNCLMQRVCCLSMHCLLNLTNFFQITSTFVNLIKSFASFVLVCF